jgi:aspartate/methionine/tyrosine aminotransferase
MFLFTLIKFFVFESFFFQMSKRMDNTENPHIEDVLDQYATIQKVNLAIGSIYWKPPTEVLTSLDLTNTETQKYGNILGYSPLREKLLIRFDRKGLDTSQLDVMITAGGNQAFFSIALALCDAGDESSA